MPTELGSPAEVHQQLVAAISNTKQSFVLVGKLLYEIKPVFLSAVGEGIDTWDDYLAQPEIGLNRGEADRLLQLYDYFVLRLGIAPTVLAGIPIKNLHYLLPMAKEDLEGAAALMDDAEHLSQKDFRERVAETRFDDGIRTYEYMVMKRCKETGTLNKVHNIESDVIRETFGLQD